MGEVTGQQVVVDDQWKRYDWKRRIAVGLLGEGKARQIAQPLTRAQGWAESTLTPSGRRNRDYIRNFQGIHAGKRCVIIGNGPSLKNTNMSLLKDEITFGLNRIYLMFDEIGFETTYHVVVNRFVVEQCADEFRKIKAPLFTAARNRPLLDGAESTAFLNNIIAPWFSRDPSHGVCEGYTVTYVAMQLAFYMGFSEVVLVGVDHRFAAKGNPNQLVESTGEDTSHFDPRYFAKGFKWQLPDLDNSEISYVLARHEFEKVGRQIIDATVDGALDVFPKMSLEEALRR